jgi:hypothetical protein
MRFFYTLFIVIAYFGLTNAQVAVGGTVWLDANGNGLIDGGEVGVPGVEVSLFDDTDNLIDGPLLTDGNGNYVFQDVLPGDYYVFFDKNTADPDYYFTTTDGGSQSLANRTTGNTDVFNVGLVNVGNIHAGLYHSCSLGDLIWEDMNANGIYEPGDGDGPLGNGPLNLTLLRWDGANTVPAIDVFENPIPVIASNSFYEFDDLPPGDYIIEIDNPNPTYFVTQYQVTGGNNDNDILPATNRTAIIELRSQLNQGENENTIGIGVFQTASIGDWCWEDTNGNGLQDGAENNGVPGVTIQIFDVSTGAPALNAFGNPIPNQISAADGSYLFELLVPGTYYLQFQEPANWFFTIPNVTGGNTNATDVPDDSDVQRNNGNITHDITVISAQEQEWIDAGLYEPASIGDFVWIDINGNGLQDGGEPPLAGVQISIEDDMGNPVDDVFGNNVGPVTSNANFPQNYIFENLPPGNYRLVFTAPADFYFTTLDAAGGPDYATDSGIDSDVDINDGNRTHVINLSSGEDEDRVDAGLYSPASVQGLVFHDAEADGMQGGLDQPLAGWQVFLETTAGGGVDDVFDNPVPPQVTDALGLYEFENLRPGEYRIRFEQQAMWFFSPQFVGGNPALDSDPNPNTGITNDFELEHEEELEDIDAGVFMQIEIGGFVWIEQDNDGQFGTNPSEFPVADVQVVIYQDIGPTGDPNPPILDLAITDMDGRYSFLVDPGHYVVALRDGNFASGAPLFGTLSCDATFPVKPSTPDQDNGYPETALQYEVRTESFQVLCGYEDGPDRTQLLTVDFCTTFDCGAIENQFSYLSCELAQQGDVICDLRILDIGCATMPDFLVEPAPTPLCPNGGAPHNMSWFPFLAGNGNYSLQVEPVGCIPAPSGQIGVQAGIYTDCSFDETPFCQSACTTAPITIDSDILVPGEIYYYFFDGCAGSVCSYNINILGDFIPYEIPDPTGLLINDSYDDMPYCPGQNLDFTVDGLDIRITYEWTIVPALDIGGEFETEENILNITFSDLGTYEVCMVRATNVCDEMTTPVCRTVVIETIPDEVFDPAPVCEGYLDTYTGPMDEDPNMDGVIGWQDPNTTWNYGLNTAFIISPDGCTYNQEIEIVELNSQGPELVQLTVCPEDIGTDYYGVILFEDIFPTPERVEIPLFASNGCDSLVDLNVIVLDIDGIMVHGPCEAEGVRMRFEQAPGSNPNFESITYIWRDPFGNIINSIPGLPNEAFTGPGVFGTFTLEIVMERFGEECNLIFEVNILESEYLAPQPVPDNWLTEFCSGTSTAEYAADVETSDEILSWNWTYPNDATVQLDGGFFIILNWAGSEGGELCVSVTTGCGESPQYCATISVVQDPIADFEVTPLVCIDSISIIEFTGTEGGNATYNWNFDGGTVVNGTGGNGPGPHHVVWTTEGDKNISLELDEFGCQSNIATGTVSVVTPVDPPVVICNPALGEVVFVWNDVEGATGYNVTVLDGMSGTQDGNSYLVTGLGEGESVTIQVEAVIDGPCGNVVSLDVACTSQDCDPPIILATPIDPICRDASSAPFDIIASTDPPTAGTFTFTGPGITDATNGTFDPQMANTGNNTIQIRFVGDDECVATLNPPLVIRVLNTPVSDFDVSPEAICITDEGTVAFTGMVTGDLVFNWTFDPAPMNPGTGPGPFNLRWDEAGDKQISLQVTRAMLCDSPISTAMIEVQPALDELILSCAEETSTSITFGWNDIDNATNYTILIDGVSQGDINGTTFTVDELDPDTEITITVTANSGNLCPSVEQSITCQAQNCPNIDISFGITDTIICLDNNAISFEIGATVSGGLGTGDATLTWSGPGVDPVTGEFDPNVAGVGLHTITLTFEEANCSESASITYEVRPQPLASFTANDVICVTDILMVEFTGTPGSTVSWIVDGGAAPIFVGGNMYELQWANAGEYAIRVSASLAGCVSNPFTGSVIVEPELQDININCTSTLNSVTFTWNAIDCVTEYEVFINGINQGSQTELDFLVDGLAEGTVVDIEVRGISDCACPNSIATSSCEARACPDIVIELSTDSPEFCEGTITNAITIAGNLTGSSGTGTGLWSGDGINQSGVISNPENLSPGTYSYTYDFTEENCDFTASISLTVFARPSISLNVINPDCYLSDVGSIVADIQGGSGNIILTMNGNEILESELSNNPPGNYQVMVRDENGCTASANTQIVAAPIPNISISGPQIIRLGTSGILTLNINQLVGNVNNIIWTSGGNTLCEGDCNTFEITPTAQTEYCVRVIFNEGCEVQTCFTVNIEIVEDIIIPNVISLGQGSRNSSFFIENFSTLRQVKSMSIYDRWGNLIFTRENITPGDPDQGWNGKFNNSTDVVPGVYVYVVELELDNENNTLITRKGDITVVR